MCGRSRTRIPGKWTDQISGDGFHGLAKVRVASSNLVIRSKVKSSAAPNQAAELVFRTSELVGEPWSQFQGTFGSGARWRFESATCQLGESVEPRVLKRVEDVGRGSGRVPFLGGDSLDSARDLIWQITK